MAFDHITLEHPDTLDLRTVPVGFSWTTLFFGFFPAFFRRDWKWGWLMFALYILSWGMSGAIFMFLYNRIHLDGLLSRGYRVRRVQLNRLQEVERRLSMKLPVVEGYRDL
ncbi:hypothetical protein [Thioalkalivibrio sp. ALE16]|uniref:hypothetical protein n=1 Tax=Thioalkalivibrio sp. ALE16 TaxID=1158172 RepID=UPI00037A8C56|nr:hypothetical protein [Thioalkalivibrio sp. ALE16]